MTEKDDAYASALGIVDELQDKRRWDLDDWKYEQGMYDGTIVTIQLEYVGGQYTADEIETGTSAEQRNRIKDILTVIENVEEDFEDGAPIDVVLDQCKEGGMAVEKASAEIENLKQKGEIYEPRTDHLRST